jgi:Leucine-rich repeat (LRR) protein
MQDFYKLKTFENFDEIMEHDEMMGVVSLPSGEYFELKRIYYKDVIVAVNWSQDMQSYVCRDKDFDKIKKYIELSKNISLLLQIAKKQGVPYDQITSLHCSYNNLTNLNGIEKLINLKKLDCSFNNLISLEGIENLINLKELHCPKNNLTNLNGIENLIDLKDLVCSHNNLTSLNGFENLINMEELWCSNNNLTNLNGIENLIDLRELWCSNNNFSNDYKKYLINYCKKKKIRLDIW